MTISSDEIITYDRLMDVSRTIDKTKQNKVLLSNYQAWLFRKKLQLMCHPPGRQPIRTLEIIVFALILLLTIITSPKLMFLADFHDVGETAFHRVSFERHQGRILVTFNPRHMDSAHPA